MTISIKAERPLQARALLEASHALMEELFPAESNHYLSLDELEADHIRFLVAREDGRVVGCGGVALYPEYAEVKSMFTDEVARGKGVADQVLSALTDIARDAGKKVLKLETGNVLHAAHRLYERHGFEKCGPFADYPDDPLSVFYEKGL